MNLERLYADAQLMPISEARQITLAYLLAAMRKIRRDVESGENNSDHPFLDRRKRGNYAKLADVSTDRFEAFMWHIAEKVQWPEILCDEKMRGVSANYPMSDAELADIELQFLVGKAAHDMVRRVRRDKKDVRAGLDPVSFKRRIGDWFAELRRLGLLDVQPGTLERYTGTILTLATFKILNNR